MEPKANLSKCIRELLGRWLSGTLLRRDSGEGGPALFYFVAAAVRAGDLFLVVLSNGQNLRKHFLARVAEELVVGHGDLSAEGVTGGILDLFKGRVQPRVMGRGFDRCSSAYNSRG